MFLYWRSWSLDGLHTLFCTTNNGLCVTIRALTTSRNFLIWMRTVRQTRTRWHRGIFKSKLGFLSMNETKNLLHLDCGRSIPATHGGYNYSRIGGASSGIMVSQVSISHQGLADSFNLHSIKRIPVWIPVCAACIYVIAVFLGDLQTFMHCPVRHTPGRMTYAWLGKHWILPSNLQA